MKMIYRLTLALTLTNVNALLLNKALVVNNRPGHTNRHSLISAMPHSTKIIFLLYLTKQSKRLNLIFHRLLIPAIFPLFPQLL